MARQRFSRPGESFTRGPNINDRIRARQVLLIDHNNQKVGVVDTIEALRRSHDAGLDLVEVATDGQYPVCRILDYGKFKYEQAKKDKANKAKSKVAELKEIRLGRSMKIDPHDIAIRIDQARRFLMDGHKVQIVQNFRGREMMHRDRGDQRMREIIEKLSDVSKVELAPRLAGRRMTLLLAPDKPKIDAINRKLAAANRNSSSGAGGGTGGGPGGGAPKSAEPEHSHSNEEAHEHSQPVSKPSAKTAGSPVVGEAGGGGKRRETQAINSR